MEIAQSFKTDSADDTRWHTSGLIDFHAPFNRFVIDKELPLITEGADEQVGRGRSQHIDRNTAAVLLDWNLRRLSQGRAVIDLRIGEFLVEFRKRHPDKLGYVRLPDYTREEMGIPWRSASLLVSNWTSLSSLPCLRQAHREGKISKSKLRWLLRVVTPQNEEAWIEKASKLSVRALEEEVRAEEAKKSGKGVNADESSSPGESDGKCLPGAGGSGSSVEEERSGYLMSLETTPERAAAWDFALEHFRGHEGGNFSTAFFIEALLAEFCSAVPLPGNGALPDTGNVINAASSDSPTSSDNPGQTAAQSNPNNPACSTVITPPLPGGAHCRRITGTEDDDFISSGADGKELDEEREKWRALRRDLEEVTKIWEFLSWTPVTVETPAEWEYTPEDVRALADMLKELVVVRQSVGFFMGRLLRTMENLHLYSDLQFASFNHYVVERLGISMRTARNLIKLVRSFPSLPLLEKAFRDGVLTQERALLLLKVVTEKTEKEWLKYGTEVSVLDLEREVKRLSRLIEADRNLLEKYSVIPEFEAPVEAKNPANSDLDSAQDLDSGTTQALNIPSEASRESSSASWKMCATEALPDAWSQEYDDSPWEVCLNNKMTDINDPSELDSWKLVVAGMLPEANDLEMFDSSRKMSATDNDGQSFDDIAPKTESQMTPASENAASSGFNPGSDSDSRPGSSFSLNPGPNLNSGSSPSPSPDNGNSSTTIRFFVPDDLIPLWNYAFMRYIELATDSNRTNKLSSSITQEIESASASNVNAEISSAISSSTENVSLTLEGFLFSLLYHYLENERIYQRKKRRLLRHKVIERDGFKCIIPGCSSRLILTDHHIKYRSHGGGDELPNNTGACRQHHLHCIHDNHYITVTGMAPDNLTIAMGVERGRAPFALFINGRRQAP
ncbi:MAG: HNH endonuclease [Vulcanimicrobiota bacterium]